MSQSLSPASLHQRLRLIGRILIYGSLGTASSAVVYLLQDQIRQIHRLASVVESRKKLAEGLRKHGIKRVQGPSFEEYILDLERRGDVKLDLVDRPPKWILSPSQDQSHNSTPVPKPTRTRPGREHHETTYDDNPRVKAPSMRKHWVDRRDLVQKLASSLISPFMRPVKFDNSFHPKVHRASVHTSSLIRLRGKPAEQEAAILSKTLDAPRTELPLDRPSSTISPKPLIKAPCLDQPQSDTQPSEQAPNKPILRRVPDLGILADEIPQSAHSLDMSFFRHDYIPADELLEIGDSTGQQQTSIYYLKQLLRDVDQEYYENDSRLLSTLYHLLRQVNADQIKKVFEDAPAPNKSLLYAFSRVLLRHYPDLLHDLASYLNSLGLARNYRPLFLESIRHQTSSEERFELFISAFDVLGIQHESHYYPTMLDVAMEHRYDTLTVQIHQKSPTMLDSSDTYYHMSALLSAYLTIPDKQVHLFDISKLIRTFGSSKHPPSPFQILNLLHKHPLKVMEISDSDLSQTFDHLTRLLKDHFQDYLDNLISTANSDIRKLVRPFMIHYSSHVLARFRETELLDRFRSKFEPSTEQRFVVEEAIMHSLSLAGRHDDACAIVFDLFDQNQQLHSTWLYQIELLNILARAGKSESILAILKTLASANHLPDDLDSRHAFTSVFWTLSKAINPIEWLDFAKECQTAYGFFFGPRAFDSIVAQIIRQVPTAQSQDLLRQLIKLSQTQLYDVGVRKETLEIAMEASIDRFGAREYYPSVFLVANWLIQISDFNQRLLTREMIDTTRRYLQIKAANDEAFLHSLKPQLEGQLWDAKYYDRMRRTRLEVRKQYLQTMTDRLHDPINQHSLASRVFMTETRVAPLGHVGNIGSNKDQKIKVVHRAIDFCLAKGQPAKAVEIFEHHMAHSGLVNEGLLKDVARAYRNTEGIGKVEELLQLAASEDLNRDDLRLMILEHQIKHDPRPNLSTLVSKWYNSGVLIRSPQLAHQPLCEAVKRILKDINTPNRGQAAISLLLEFPSTIFPSTVPLTIEYYLSFLAAYSRCNDITGYSWVLASVLASDLIITDSFISTLRLSIRDMMVSSGLHKDDPEAARMKTYLVQLYKACHTQAHYQRSQIQSADRQMLNVLLYDARHPDVDDLVYSTAPDEMIQLDSKVTSQNRMTTMNILSQYADEQSITRRETYLHEKEHWLNLHTDSPDHPLQVNSVLSAAEQRLVDLTKSLANTTEPYNTANIDPLDLEDNISLMQPLDLEDVADSDIPTLQRSMPYTDADAEINMSNLIPWTTYDTLLLADLEKHVTESGIPYPDLATITAALKATGRHLEHVPSGQIPAETALEQLIMYSSIDRRSTIENMEKPTLANIISKEAKALNTDEERLLSAISIYGRKGRSKFKPFAKSWDEDSESTRTTQSNTAPSWSTEEESPNVPAFIDLNTSINRAQAFETDEDGMTDQDRLLALLPPKKPTKTGRERQLRRTPTSSVSASVSTRKPSVNPQDQSFPGPKGYPTSHPAPLNILSQQSITQDWASKPQASNPTGRSDDLVPGLTGEDSGINPSRDSLGDEDRLLDAIMSSGSGHKLSRPKAHSSRK